MMKFAWPITLFLMLGAFGCTSATDATPVQDSEVVPPAPIYCAKIRLVEVRSGTHATGSVGAFFLVDDCDGEPIVGLNSDQLTVYEDSVDSHLPLGSAKLLKRTPELFISLVLERSEETLKPEVASEIISGAKKLVDDVFANSSAKGVRVSVSFVSDHWELAQKFSRDRVAIDAAIERFNASSAATTMETKGLPTAHRSFEGLAHALGYSLQTHGPPCGAMKGSVWMLGQTVMITGGEERQEDYTLAEVEAVLDKSGEDMIVVKTGQGPWEGAWNTLARNGLFEAQDPGQFTDVMGEASTRLLALRERAYSLAYCGTNDSGFHELTLGLSGTDDRSNSLLFDASLLMIDDLDLQCTQDLFSAVCEDPLCSGLRCDGCAPEGLDFCIASGNCWEVLCTYGSPGLVSMDASHVYWTDTENAEILRIEKATGDYSYEPQILVTGLESPNGIALDDEWVYWTDPGTGRVQRALKAGGAPEDIASDVVGLDQVIVGLGRIFWTSTDGVWMVEKGGGVPTQIGDATDRTAGLALWQDEVFWSRPDSGQVMGWNSASDNLQVLVHDQPDVDAIAVDASYVYFTTKNDLMRVAKSGGEPELLAQSPTFPRDIGIDSSHVYWTYDEEVYRVPKSGGSKEQIAKEKPMGQGIAVDETHVYWAGLAQILKLAHH